MNCEPAMNGVPSTTSEEVARFAHTSSGIRQKLMPGARMLTIVTRKLTAVAIDEAPANCTPSVKKVLPIWAGSDSGADFIQPASIAVTTNEARKIKPPGSSNQQDSAFRRAKA